MSTCKLDHFNFQTIKTLMTNRPTLRIGCGEWMAKYLEGIKNVDIYEIGKVYDYGSFKVSPVKLYHDCENFGYRIFKGNYKIIHCTDTSHLEGIIAKDYDLFCIESNYNAETIQTQIESKEAKGEFSYKRGAINSHLSEQQCNDFFLQKQRRK